ncbi:Chemotaxis OmpA/MotB domain protein [Methylocella tundrae]|uniref:Chemotaxis OmpA/MotB domain protein n=1 Tax=Methylocella tundrae TaxID=227605 RepID=A0A4U8YTC2_METTU|nr:MotB family protein [Methylocella tundrae]VFU06935.1 Chemotaxis OmpA/MotB domain protein [Methylocella tundrae]
MASKEDQEIVIIKRHAAQEDGHHGGAWKIAFADFMTAMMALFLVLWLISSTSDKTKHAVAQYFNPVKLVDVTTLKKGFRDPKNTEMGAGPKSSESKIEADTDQNLAETKEVAVQPGAKLPTHSESALFRDPYAVLAEIAGQARVDETPKPTSGPAPTAAAESAPDTLDSFSDPFTTIPHVAEPAALSQAAPASIAAQAATAGQGEHSHPPAHDATAARPNAEVRTHGSGPAAGPDSVAETPQLNEADAAKLKADVMALAKQEGRSPAGPHIEVQSTGEGLLISLTDDRNFAMFAIGSAEPQSKTIEVMAKIAELLKTRAGAIVVRGHTDARPFKSATYDNWRLSTARAHMAHYMLVRGGLDDKRIEKIEGYADRRLKIAADPMAAANRRIEILLRKDKP